MSDYAIRSAEGYEPDQDENVLSSIFKQYESVIVQSLITSFGLDFLVTDRHGGDVDTIHNVRQIGSDPEMQYKNAANKAAYDNRGEYNSSEYHSDSRYISKNREVSAQKKSGELYDSYTGEKIAFNEKSDLDHVVSAKEIHDDRGRVLAGLSGTDLANSEENLQATNPHTNRTKKADSMDKFLDKHGSFSTYMNPETKQLILSGTGDQQLDVLVSKLKSRFGVDAVLSPAKVAYRERIKKTVEAHGRHKKQTGGSGQFGDVWIRFEPQDEQDDMIFAEEVFGGSVPKNFYPAVEKGIQEIGRAHV